MKDTEQSRGRRVFAAAQRDGETTSHEEESEELEPARQVTHWQCLKDRKQMIDRCVRNRMEGKGWQAGNTLPWMGGVGREMLVEA